MTVPVFIHRFKKFLNISLCKHESIEAISCEKASKNKIISITNNFYFILLMQITKSNYLGQSLIIKI